VFRGNNGVVRVFRGGQTWNKEVLRIEAKRPR
jgi:hypothetical protein